MRRSNAWAALPFACAFICIDVARAQGGRGAADWVTAGADAQRSSWIRTDRKISVASMQKPGFQLVWKVKLADEPALAGTLDAYIGYRGFRSFAFTSSAAGNLTAFDTDLGRVEWKKTLSGSSTRGGAVAPCSGLMTANLARPTSAGFPLTPAGRGAPGAGRATGAKSAVGEPGEGGVTIAERAARLAAAAAAPPTPGRGAPPVPVVNSLYATRVSPLNAISSDGMFHSMYVSNGDEPNSPVPFIPANVNAHGLIVLSNTAYVATSGSCGNAPNGVWALSFDTKEVTHWSTSADIAGSTGPAFGPDGAAYVTTTGGELVALEPKTLLVRATYRAGGQAFASSPVVFEYNKSTLVAAVTVDGNIHLVDAATLIGAAYPAGLSNALISWQDSAGVRWIAGRGKDSITAWKVIDQGGAPAIQPGWTSPALASPLTPIIVNGVVFAVTNSPLAVIHALDAATGKELWNSGKTVAAGVVNGALSAIGGQLYLGASDGVFYAFGFPIEH